MKVLQSVKRAALFLADVLSSGSFTAQLKKHGIKDRKYKARLEERLRTEYTLDPPTREGRPGVYTAEQLAAGEEALSGPAQTFHSGAQLVQHLKEEGELPASATQRGYVTALKRHLAAKGLQLGYGVRSKQHAITAAVAAKRLAWCKEMQQVITSTTVKQWHFADEKPHSGSQLSTANRRSAPQLYIKGVTPKPKALMKDKAEDKSNWLAVVVIKHGHPPAVYPVSKKANPHPHSVWLRKEGNLQHVDLTGTAYVKIMHQHLIGKGNLSDGTITRPRRTRYLLHDRDPAHTSKAFRAFAKNYNVHGELLPSHSPDLDPLDYGVFGPAQRKLDRAMERRRMSWDEQCSFLEQAIKEANVDAAIEDLPRRIKKCIAAKGWHFE